MLRMLIVGYCMGIRSERRLCEEVHLIGLSSAQLIRNGRNLHACRLDPPIAY